MRWMSVVLAGALALSAPAHAADVTITIDPASIAQLPADAPTVNVDVSDIRDKVASERQSLGVSLGNVTFDPSEASLVQGIVAAKAAAFYKANPSIAVPEAIYCGIRQFAVATPSTMLYWDVKATIEIVLRVGDKDRVVAHEARERTYVYPTQKLIDKVTRQALGKVADGVGPALRELAAP